MEDSEKKALLAFVMAEYHAVRKSGCTEGAWKKAIANVANSLGLSEQQVKDVVNEARKIRYEKAKAKTEPEQEPEQEPVIDIPRGIPSKTNIFDLEDAASIMAVSLKGTRIKGVIEFHCKSSEQTKQLRGICGKAVKLARWRSYQTRVVDNILYVRRTK